MISFRLMEYDEVASTNDVVKRAIEAGEPEGFAARADVQTAGYGRQGRAWKSPEGGMYLSLLLRPQVEPCVLPTLSLATAIAVRRALASLVAPEAAAAIRLKWPNDIVVGGSGGDGGAGDGFSYRKLAGLSHELHAGAMCVGIGVNAIPPESGAIETGGKNAPIYLRDLPGAQGATPALIADAVLREYAPVYDAWRRGGIAPFLPEYDEHAFLTGRTIRIANIDGAVTCEGIVRGIDEDARLVVIDADGGVCRIASGEAHLV